MVLVQITQATHARNTHTHTYTYIHHQIHAGPDAYSTRVVPWALSTNPESGCLRAWCIYICNVFVYVSIRNSRGIPVPAHDTVAHFSREHAERDVLTGDFAAAFCLPPSAYRHVKFHDEAEHDTRAEASHSLVARENLRCPRTHDDGALGIVLETAPPIITCANQVATDGLKCVQKQTVRHRCGMQSSAKTPCDDV
jgi:hypothetical protein